MTPARARFGGVLATGLLDVTSDPAALDGSGWWAVVAPYDGAPVGTIYDASPAQVDAAIAAAAAAAPVMREMTLDALAQALERLKTKAGDDNESTELTAQTPLAASVCPAKLQL